LLRTSLTTDQKETVPFAQELEVVENYLALQQLRFDSRLRVSQQVSPDALNWLVPPFPIQELVENAVRFGIAPREAGGEISLRVSICDHVFHAQITNPGRISTASDSTGLGLSNGRERLASLFGPTATLALSQQAEDLVAAEVSIPRPADASRSRAP
jgi:LytS/YehU family sensor histidine kinase